MNRSRTDVRVTLDHECVPVHGRKQKLEEHVSSYSTFCGPKLNLVHYLPHTNGHVDSIKNLTQADTE